MRSNSESTILYSYASPSQKDESVSIDMSYSPGLRKNMHESRLVTEEDEMDGLALSNLQSEKSSVSHFSSVSMRIESGVSLSEIQRQE